MNKIYTSCKDCVFKSSNSENIQIGCKFNKIDIFEKRDEAWLEEDYFVINRICTHCRNKEWEDKFDNPEEQIKEETKIKIDIVVLSESGNHKKIINTLMSILTNKFYPNSITISIKNNIDIKDLYLKLNDILAIKCPFKINHSINENYILNITDKNQGKYSSIIKEGEMCHHHYFSKLLNRIENKLQKIIYIEPTEYIKITTVSNNLLKKLNFTNYEEMNKHVKQCIIDYNIDKYKNEFIVNGDDLCRIE
jgi:hypothetical protein